MEHLSKRLKNEYETVGTMIAMYCKRHHGTDGLCDSCNKLEEYTLERLNQCRFGDDKPACNTCPVHCYRPDMRARIRDVMRYAGPRMIISHPIMAIRHLINRRNPEK